MRQRFFYANPVDPLLAGAGEERVGIHWKSGTAKAARPSDRRTNTRIRPRQGRD